MKISSISILEIFSFYPPCPPPGLVNNKKERKGRGGVMDSWAAFALFAVDALPWGLSFYQAVPGHLGGLPDAHDGAQGGCHVGQYAVFHGHSRAVGDVHERHGVE